MSESRSSASQWPGSQFSKILAATLLATAGLCAQEMPDVLQAPQRAPYRWFASTDPKRQNDDYIMLKPGETRRVPLAAGPLLRLWSTSSQPEKMTLRLQNGGETVPLWQNNRALTGTLYEKAFTLYPDQSTSTALRDLKPDAALIATNDSKEAAKWYYQVSIGPRLPTLAKRPSTPVTSTVQLSPNQSEALYPKAKAGLWTQIEITAKAAERERDPKPDDNLNLWRNLYLVARWSGAVSLETPNPNDNDIQAGMNVPLLALTGQFWSDDKIQSAPVSFDGETLTLRWPLPFGPNDRVTIRNAGQKKVLVSYKLTEVALPESQVSPYRFHAVYGSAPAQRKKPIPIVEVNGEGAFVGLALDIRPTAESPRRAFAYLEGNETLHADGKSYEGTGTEDYFNSAWYYPAKPFAQPFGGMPFKNALPPQVSQYRWMIPDAVPFRKEFRFVQEHGNGNNADDLEYRWVAMWYQKPGGRFQISDELRYGAAVDLSPEKNRERDALVRRYILGTSAVLLLIAVAVTAITLLRPRRTVESSEENQ